MEIFMKVILPILVLMIVGAGFMYIHGMTDSSAANFCFRCIE